MYGPAGHAYVYFTYGHHWMFNVVTEREGFPSAVLVRAVQPTAGIRTIARRRSGGDTYGPGKLTQALGITGDQNDVDLTMKGSGLWIEPGRRVSARNVVRGPRIGLQTVPEPWKSLAWRFVVRGWAIDRASHTATAEMSGSPG
jgi:DNA-3-methyladenine glycosylase